MCNALWDHYTKINQPHQDLCRQKGNVLNNYVSMTKIMRCMTPDELLHDACIIMEAVGHDCTNLCPRHRKNFPNQQNLTISCIPKPKEYMSQHLDQNQVIDCEGDSRITLREIIRVLNYKGYYMDFNNGELVLQYNDEVVLPSSFNLPRTQEDEELRAEVTFPKEIELCDMSPPSVSCFDHFQEI